MNLLNQQKKIGVITVLSGLLALASLIAVLIAVNFNSDILSDPLLILSTQGISATAVRWSMILDMFGYYLLLLPVIYLLNDWMKERSSWSNLVTFCGIAYVLIGSLGASVLAVVWPKIIAGYTLANVAEQQILKANFSLINDMVYGGMWNLLEMTFSATWWIFIGLRLLNNKFKFIGWLSLIAGIFCLGDATSGVFLIGWLHELSLNAYLLFSIIWTIAIGIFLIKCPLK
jgi:hypothetical protein